MLSLLLDTSEDAGCALTRPRCAQMHSKCIVGLVVLWWCVQLQVRARSDTN